MNYEQADTITDDTITRLTRELNSVNINLTDSRRRQTELSSLIAEAVREQQRQQQHINELNAKLTDITNEKCARMTKIATLRGQLADALNRAGYGTDAC